MRPPLKSATGSALFIISQVRKFRQNKKEWEGFGKYVVDNVAKVVVAVRTYDTSAQEATSWVESATKLDGVLQTIKSEIDRRLAKTENRSALINALSRLRDSGRIDGLKRDFDGALASLQFQMNSTIGATLPAMEDSIGRLQRQNSWFLRHPNTDHYDPTGPCLNGTRVGLIKRIMTWCRNTGDNENRLMLLTAVAGAGKTSIALTVAEQCEEEATLLLSFFFKAGEQSWPDRLLSGIASALEDHDPVYGDLIASARRKDPTLSTAPLLIQFKKLVASPLLHNPPLPTVPWWSLLTL
ncbi:uncharacterized protein EI90DRAFT_1728165 [Cantharellus anzutake]|uniref:uncharacterized protein n=1 Tax=Cantharellus anzutake TaxID=1750568 RepID=UPI0019065190|nr:uncharacterized protein EI90DRAFT_1728165 [Cantharellus anzutake]KAF8341375.1 hypothetical protein EI90DRAFT_1728165 [Cantharellus anzutake]